MKRRIARTVTVVSALTLGAGVALAPGSASAAGPPDGPPLAATPVQLSLSGLFTVHGEPLTVPRRAVVFSGLVAHYAPHQRLHLVASVDGHVFLRRVLSMARRGQRGHFQTTLSAPRAGHVRIELSHVRNRRMLSFVQSIGFAVLENSAAPGATGRFVQLIQQRLAALHLFIPQTGVFDQGTELALDAYHRVLGEGEGHVQLDPPTVTALLNGVGSFHVRYPAQGHHAEGDLSDQVLAFTDGSQVQWLFPISSGKPSTPTILGNFQVYYKQPEYTQDGMYFSSFFHGGYAIHGYNPAPAYPASHGCMRLPMVDAVPAYNWIQVGDWVDTYYT